MTEVEDNIQILAGTRRYVAVPLCTFDAADNDLSLRDVGLVIQERYVVVMVKAPKLERPE